MKKILFAIVVIGLIACSSDDPENCCTLISLRADIKYENEEGVNLLDDSDIYEISKIEVYHKMGGEWKRYFEGNLDDPNGLRMTEINEERYLTVFLSNNINDENISETKLVFENGDEDVIKSALKKDSGSEIVTKIWYNGDLKWSNGENVEARFTIVK